MFQPADLSILAGLWAAYKGDHVEIGAAYVASGKISLARQGYARYDRLAGDFASRIGIDGSLVSDLPDFATDVRGKCWVTASCKTID